MVKLRRTNDHFPTLDSVHRNSNHSCTTKNWKWAYPAAEKHVEIGLSEAFNIVKSKHHQEQYDRININTNNNGVEMSSVCKDKHVIDI